MTNDGRPFQREIETILIQYQSRGLLRAKKVDPPVRVLGFGARRQVIFQRNPWLDYVGVWRERGGRAVMFEAKSTAEARLPFGKDSGVTKAQLEAMHHWGEHGAVVFVLWQVRDKKPTTYMVIEEAFGEAASAGAKSVTPENEYVFQIGRGDGRVTADFLECMRAVWPN